MQITVTIRHKLRPLLDREIAPNSNPSNAKGMISQLSDPKNGMKPIMAIRSATAPMISERILSIAVL